AGSGGSVPTFTGTTQYQGTLSNTFGTIEGEILTVASLSPANSIITHPLGSGSVGMFFTSNTAGHIPARTFIKDAVTTVTAATVVTGGTGSVSDGPRRFRGSLSNGVAGIKATAVVVVQGTVTSGALGGTLTVLYGGWYKTFPTNPLEIADMDGGSWSVNPS